MEPSSGDIAVIILLSIISAVGIAIRYLRLPYPIALLLTGLGLSVLVRSTNLLPADLPLEQIRLTPHLILVVFLPALLFESTLHIEATALRKTLLPVALLALPGVILTALLVGAFIHWTLNLPWMTGLLFGAIVSATDPIAVIAIVKRIGAPHELALLVEAESLFNDGTAVVLSRVLLSIALTGTFQPFASVLNFVVVVGGGIIVGAITGNLVSRITAHVDDHLIEITLTTILTYGTFVIAEALHVSGVIAVVICGLVLGNVGARSGMSPTTRLALLNFWEYVAFILNGVIFLLIGLQVNLASLVADVVPITIAVLVVLLARAVVVYGLGFAILRLPSRIPLRWLHILFWAGLRGGVSLAVVLGLPAALPGRALVFNLTVGIVLWTLVVQGLTVELLLKWLGISSSDAQLQTYLRSRADLLIARAARQRLHQLQRDAHLVPHVAAHIDDLYARRENEIDATLKQLYRENVGLEIEELRATREQLLTFERSSLAQLQQQGMVDSTTAATLAGRIDGQLVALRDHEAEEVPHSHPDRSQAPS
ncbi:MAG: Na+/H+ antiporter [Herpetosiphon sp.]